MIILPEELDTKASDDKKRLTALYSDSDNNIDDDDDDNERETNALLNRVAGSGSGHNNNTNANALARGALSSATFGSATGAEYHQQQNQHHLVDMVPQEPPPEFAPYDAEHFEVGYQDIVSHDPHLNSDGEALYRFLLSQCLASHPTYRIQIRGTHTESRSRIVTHRDAQGRSHTRTERYNDTITDFDFCVAITPGAIDVERGVAPGDRERVPNRPIHWTAPDDIPAYRGKMVREYDVEPYKANAADVRTRLGEWSAETGRRSARRKETKVYKKMMESRMRRGFPPWGDSNGAEYDEPGLDEEGWARDNHYPRPQDIQWGAGGGGIYARNRGAAMDPAAVSVAEKDTLRSSKTLRQWADEYCQSPKQLKEFVYTKTPYGWNIAQIESAIRASILATPYNGNLTVETVPYNTKIYIRPDNKVSRWLSNKWLRFLSIILFIFPFIWLYKRFHSKGGGKWEVGGAAYPLKMYADVHTEEELEEAERELAAVAQGLEIPGHSGSSSSGSGGGALPTRRPGGGGGGKSDDLPPNYSDLSPSHSQPSSSSSFPSGSSPLPAGIIKSRRYMQTPTGIKKLVGIKEGEWFKSWEGAITRAVVGRYQSNVPLPRNSRSTGQARGLDGYLDDDVSPVVVPGPPRLVDF